MADVISAPAVDEFSLYVFSLCSLFCSCVLSRRLCAGLMQFYSVHVTQINFVLVYMYSYEYLYLYVL